MKRSPIGPKTYEEALSLRIASQARQREKAALSPRRPRKAKHSLKSKPRKAIKRSRPSPEETAWRKEVLERDGYRCRWIDPQTDQRCSECGPHVQAHHINERSQRPDLGYDVDNGAAICPFHHDFAHHHPKGRKEARAQGLLSTAVKYEYRDRTIEKRSVRP